MIHRALFIDDQVQFDLAVSCLSEPTFDRTMQMVTRIAAFEPRFIDGRRDVCPQCKGEHTLSQCPRWKQ